MSEKPKIRTKKPVGTILFLLMGGFGMCLLSYYLISSSFNAEYPKIAGLILGSYFGAIGLFCFVGILWLDQLEIYKNRLEIKSIFGFYKKTILLSDFTTWTEIERKTKYIQWKELTIYTDKSKYMIVSSFFSNYEQVKNELVSERKRVLKTENKWYERSDFYWAISSLILGLIYFWGSYNAYVARNSKLSDNELTTITSEITNKPEIYKGSKGTRSITIHLKNYPDFEFDLYGASFSAAYANDFVSNVKIGDTLFLDIMTDEYEKKLTKKNQLTFFDKTVNYHSIAVYGLKDHQIRYLSLADYNIGHTSDKGLGILGCGLGLFLIGLGSYILKGMIWPATDM